MFAAGDSFLIADSWGVKHLHIIISDPVIDPENIVLVPITSWENDKDETCILEEADREGIAFLKHNSCVDYGFSLVTSATKLSRLLDSRQATPLPPVNQRLVEKIRSRANEAQGIPNKCLMALEKQNLI